MFATSRNSLLTLRSSFHMLDSSLWLSVFFTHMIFWRAGTLDTQKVQFCNHLCCGLCSAPLLKVCLLFPVPQLILIEVRQTACTYDSLLFQSFVDSSVFLFFHICTRTSLLIFRISLTGIFNGNCFEFMAQVGRANTWQFWVFLSMSIE